MPVFWLLCPLLLVGCARGASTTSDAPPDSLILFSFDDNDTSAWTVQNDGVMGGDSKGFVEVNGNALVFTGTVVTQGGGFTSALASVGANLGGYDGLEMRVRGGGRTFEIEIDDGTTNRGRQVSRRAPFETADAWQTVRIPFADLETSVFGEPVQAPPLDVGAIEALGLYIIDGQDGPFRLEVDWIHAYRNDP